MSLRPDPIDADWPEYGLLDDVRPAIAEICAAGAVGALATLIAADGPSPRPLGAQMAIAPRAGVAGYVSGGCVEGALALIGREVAATGAARIVRFGAGGAYADVRLVCGGTIDILVEPLRPSDPAWREIDAAARARRPVVRLAGQDGPVDIRDAAPGEPALHVAPDGRYARRYDPRWRVVVIGRDPVALALARLAQAAGFDVALVRPKGPPAAPPDHRGLYAAAAPAPALDALGLDRWTAVVATTHDLEEDHEALRVALPSAAAYVGALGSRRRLAERLARLEGEGLAWEVVRRLRAPVGLDIGAATPFEIAVAILADIVRAFRRG